jgi:hypothetical protein
MNTVEKYNTDLIGYFLAKEGKKPIICNLMDFSEIVITSELLDNSLYTKLGYLLPFSKKISTEHQSQLRNVLKVLRHSYDFNYTNALSSRSILLKMKTTKESLDAAFDSEIIDNNIKIFDRVLNSAMIVRTSIKNIHDALENNFSYHTNRQQYYNLSFLIPYFKNMNIKFIWNIMYSNVIIILSSIAFLLIITMLVVIIYILSVLGFKFSADKINNTLKLFSIGHNQIVDRCMSIM